MDHPAEQQGIRQRRKNTSNSGSYHEEEKKECYEDDDNITLSTSGTKTPSPSPSPPSSPRSTTITTASSSTESNYQQQQQQRDELLEKPKPIYSAGVEFCPPSSKYWRIGGKFYDLEPFLEKHPGGSQILLLARDRFEDATFVVEANHMNYSRIRKIIAKYEVELPAEDDADDGQTREQVPKLLNDDAFYSVIRRRVAQHLKSVHCPVGEPTWECLGLFWAVFFSWASLFYATWYTGRFPLAVVTAIMGSWLGGFGHNWVHQPKYKTLGFALLSLDTQGFSSEGWYRDHVLQHHMYTNTPWDNHFKGTDPFLITDPTVERNWIQRHVMPYVYPIILCFGVYGNYTKHTIDLLQGLEVVSIGKLFLPFQFYLMISRWGLVKGVGLMWTMQSVLGVYYFTLALMNHNTEATLDIKNATPPKIGGLHNYIPRQIGGSNCHFIKRSYTCG